MNADAGYACTVTHDEVPARRGQVHRLVAGLRQRDRDDPEIRLCVDAELAPTVHAFVRDEARCCDFYEFAVTEHDRSVELRVCAPAGAEPLLASLYEVFDPRSGPRLNAPVTKEAPHDVR